MFPCNIFRREGSYTNSLSAPRQNTKSRSPSSASDTKASVVKVSDTCAKEISTPSVLSTYKRNVPNGSFPTQPKKMPLPPNLAMAQATFAGAPPAFLVNSVALERSLPCFSATKSINSSPTQNIFFIFLEISKVHRKNHLDQNRTPLFCGKTVLNAYFTSIRCSPVHLWVLLRKIWLCGHWLWVTSILGSGLWNS